MKVETKGHTTTIKETQNNLEAFVQKLEREYKTFENQNLILDLLKHDDVTVANIKSFMPLAKLHKKNKKSFVLVVNDFDFNKVPTSLTIVPTKLEAHDIIEMEEIERDLGF